MATRQRRTHHRRRPRRPHDHRPRTVLENHPRLSPHRAALPAPSLTRRRNNIVAALRKPGLTAKREPYHAAGTPVDKVPTNLEGAEHARVRRMLQPAFSPRSVAKWTPALRQQARERVGAIAGKGECEALTEIAIPFATEAVLQFLGLDLDRGQILEFVSTGQGELIDSVRHLVSAVLRDDPPAGFFPATTARRRPPRRAHGGGTPHHPHGRNELKKQKENQLPKV